MYFFLSTYDFILAPIYLVLAFLFSNAYFKNQNYGDPELEKYHKSGLRWKFFGCIAIAIIYEFYYRGSYDGRFYFDTGRILTRYWVEHPGEFFSNLFQGADFFNKHNKGHIFLGDTFCWTNESFNVAKFVGIFNLLSFNCFMPCSIFFCFIAFRGVWRLYVLFVQEYKIPYKAAAYCTLLIPSILIWDSSIFKDTITFTALCWAFVCGYYTFFKPRNLVRNVVGLVFSLYMIFLVKPYILGAYVPFYIFYIFNNYKASIKNVGLRKLASPVMMVLMLGVLALLSQKSDEALGRYNVDQVMETASVTYYYITEAAAGSAYTMNVDLTSPLGILLAIPQGINVTLFRPYPWEYLKPFTMIAAIESMILLGFTVYVFYRVGLANAFRRIWSQPILQFCFLFSLTFAFMVGVSSANFGSLVRYKIPCLPFFNMFLAILYYSGENKVRKQNVRIMNQRRLLGNQ